MLEKIGLPAKPSLRGNNWVVDSTHCQGCSSQFTFINRKHHCRRCGGLFCNSCTQQRMVLRGQGDSPVRICEPCKELEEAARFEMRHGQRSRARRGGNSGPTRKCEDEVLNQILGNDGKETFSSGSVSNADVDSSIQRTISNVSCSNAQEATGPDEGGGIRRSHSVDEPSHILSEIGSISPEELRQRALDEKKKYKILKGEGKSEEALRSFKRGKELERQAEAMELNIRKNRRKVSSSGSMAEIQNKDGRKESNQKSKNLPPVAKDKDDLMAELRELGWSDKDLRDEDKKPASMSVEGELSSLLGEFSEKTNKDMGSSSVDKSQVVAYKKKALMLKREGKLAEAKEELKKAKILEKQLEEQELLAGAEDSDDEISGLIHGMDNDPQDDLLIGFEQENGLSLDRLMNVADEAGMDSNFEVTDEDMADPEIGAALKSLGWPDDAPESIVPQSVSVDREKLLSEILLLKREALNKKRAGNIAEAMAHLKKAKLLERDLENFESQVENFSERNPEAVQKISAFQIADKAMNSVTPDEMGLKFAPRSKLTIQKELLSLKKKALSLRREGKFDEAEEELKKGKALELQLEEMDNPSKGNTTQVTSVSTDSGLAYEHASISRDLPVDEGEGEVTDQDMHDPAYLSVLRNLGWNEEDNELASLSHRRTKAGFDNPVAAPRRTKAQIQRELLGLKRKALNLRREGKVEEAEEVLRMAKPLEDQIAEMEAPKKEVQVGSYRPKEKIIEPPRISASKEDDEVDVTESDTHDPELLTVLKDFGWKDDELEPVNVLEEPPEQVANNSVHSMESLIIQSSTSISTPERKSKGEIQRELLGLKRRALVLRREGESEEAEAVLKMAKVLEVQMEELEGPNKELLVKTFKDNHSGTYESSSNHEKQGIAKDAFGVSEGSTLSVVDLNDKMLDSLNGLGLIKSEKSNTSSRNLVASTSVTPQLIDYSYSLLGELEPSSEVSAHDSRTAKGTGLVPPPSQSTSVMDLLSGDDWRGSELPVERLEQHEHLVSKDNVRTGTKEEMVQVDEKPRNYSLPGLASEVNQNSLKQEILAHKRKALALKREGKLTEAREELRQAKLLEKSLEEEKTQPKSSPSDVSKFVSVVPSGGQNEQGVSNSSSKPLSGRDRFKLQQESLSHKRKALKFRREGRMEEAEAELELAKALETQLEELATHDSSHSSAKGAESFDDVTVESFLDPQLLSALKAIGLEDVSTVSQVAEKPVPVKPSAGQSEILNQERVQLEERIREEKMKALNLKRSGKQAEALDALRQAKLFEKKLNSLI